jgi:hypothetical protein
MPNFTDMAYFANQGRHGRAAPKSAFWRIFVMSG